MDAEQISREQHKPLTAAEIGELRGRIDFLRDVVTDEPTIGLLHLTERLLSMLQPPADAAADDLLTRCCRSLDEKLGRTVEYPSSCSQQPPTLTGWAIDTSTGTPILTYEKCSVIQDEQAEQVMALLRASQQPADAAVREAVGALAVQLEHAEQDGGVCHVKRKHARTLLSYVRAVQLPRLTEHTDDLAVDDFATAMKAKLAQKRAEGRSGWDDPDECHIDFLVSLLHGHIQKGDPIDIANITMMLWSRGLRGNGSVPAPRLTGEQVEAVRNLRMVADSHEGLGKAMNEAVADVEAAFPGLFGGE